MNRSLLFDAVRDVLGRPFRQHEVETIDRALDELVDGAPVQKGRQTSPRGVALIKKFEGLARVQEDGSIVSYPDPGTGGAPWTIGWGATGPGIGPGTIWTREQADRRLAADIDRHAADVSRAIGHTRTSQGQFDALVSFHYNTGAIHRATLTRHHVAGNYEAASREFARWNKAGGLVLRGLIRRRAEEARLYRSGV